MNSGESQWDREQGTFKAVGDTSYSLMLMWLLKKQIILLAIVTYVVNPSVDICLYIAFYSKY